MTTFYPSFRYRDARAAIAWLQDAFGFEVNMVVDGKDEEVVHAQLSFGDGMIMLGSDRDDRWGLRAGRGWVYVALDGDVDGHCERARRAGAEIVMEPADQEYGSRDYAARNPEGNLWNFGTYR